MNQNPYLIEQVSTASPVQLIVLLYDGAIQFLRNAHDGFGERDPQTKNETIHNNLIKAQNIFTELNSCLDMDLGGNVALQLRDLYDCWNINLREINIRKDSKIDMINLLRIIRHVSELRDSWRQLAERTIPVFRDVQFAQMAV